MNERDIICTRQCAAIKRGAITNDSDQLLIIICVATLCSRINLIVLRILTTIQQFVRVTWNELLL